MKMETIIMNVAILYKTSMCKTAVKYILSEIYQRMMECISFITREASGYVN